MLAVRWCVRYILWQWWKVCYHGNSISGQENGENFADSTTSTLFRHLKWNLAHMVAIWCSCAKHTFWQWRKVCCHGNGILCQKLRGKSDLSSLPHLRLLLVPKNHFLTPISGPIPIYIIHNAWWITLPCLKSHELQVFDLGISGKCMSNQIWHTCWRWSVAVHDTFWDSGGMCVAMVTAYSKNWKTKHFTSNSKEIGFTCWPWGVDVQETFWRMGENVLPW